MSRLPSRALGAAAVLLTGGAVGLAAGVPGPAAAADPPALTLPLPTLTIPLTLPTGTTTTPAPAETTPAPTTPAPTQTTPPPTTTAEATTTQTVTVAVPVPTPTPAPPAPVPAATTTAGTKPAAAPFGVTLGRVGALDLRRALRRSFRVPVRCSSTCTVVLRLEVDGRTAKRHGVGSGRASVLVARGTGRSGSRARGLRVRATKAGRRLAARAPRTVAVLRVRART